MEFSALLQKLIRISNVKPQVLADRMGYDVSYISKWQSGAKLPSSRNAEELFGKMAHFFAVNTEAAQQKEIKEVLGLEYDGAGLEKGPGKMPSSVAPEAEGTKGRAQKGAGADFL